MRLGLMSLSLGCVVVLSGFGPASSGAQAPAPAHSQTFDVRAGRALSSCHDPGKFSEYMLALSWSPSFCSASGGNCKMGECKNLSGSFAGKHLTLHGLWPQYTDAEAPHGCSYPSACPGPAYDKKALPADMATYAPAYTLDGLGTHEWPKHGTCSGLKQPVYYQDAIQLIQSLGGDQGTPDAITQNLGGQVDLQTLQRAFSNVPPESVALSCDNACNLQQVGICFGADAQGNPQGPAPCPRSVTGAAYDNSCVVGGGGKTPQNPMCPKIKIRSPAGTCSSAGSGKHK